MNRVKIVAGNWKMNTDLETGLELFTDIMDGAGSEVNGSQKIVICPPFTHLASLKPLLKDRVGVSLGAQNCNEADSGAYTGEVSVKMLKSVGASYVILGHSERRQYFNETNKQLADKLDAVLGQGLIPIFCIGETLEERNSGSHFQVIESQLMEAAFQLSAEQFEKLVIAYEPVWAIGTGLTASPEQAQEVHAFIRSKIASRYGDDLAQGISILYGGSCNPKNASDLFQQTDIDGGLIGGASLKAQDFISIAKMLNA